MIAGTVYNRYNRILRRMRFLVVLVFVVVGVLSSSVLANYVKNVQICCGRTAAEAHNKTYYYAPGEYDNIMSIPIGGYAYYCGWCEECVNPDELYLYWNWNYQHGPEDCRRDDYDEFHMGPRSHGCYPLVGVYEPSLTVWVGQNHGHIHEGSNHDTCKLNVVEVDRIGVWGVKGGQANWWDETGETVYVLKGSKFTFEASPNPIGPWPTNDPDWTYSGADSYTTDGDRITITFTSTGTKTLWASCGSSTKSVTIEVQMPEVCAVGFGGDRTLYKNPTTAGGWGDGVAGEYYTDPVYDADSSKDDPVCVTKNSSTVFLTDVELEVGTGLTFLTIINVDASGTEEWNASGYVDFEDDHSDECSLGITGNIVNSVKYYNGDFQIVWKYKVPNGSNTWYTINSTSHTMYVKWSNTTGGHSLTEKRIKFLCGKCSGDTTLVQCAGHIWQYMGIYDPPTFDLHADAPDNRWWLMRSPYKGDCYALAQLLQDGYQLLGCGNGEIGYIYGSTDSTCYSTNSRAHETHTCGTHGEEKIYFGGNPNAWNKWEGVFHVNGWYYAAELHENQTPKNILNFILGANVPGAGCTGMHQAWQKEGTGSCCTSPSDHPVPKP